MNEHEQFMEGVSNQITKFKKRIADAHMRIIRVEASLDKYTMAAQHYIDKFDQTGDIEILYKVVGILSKIEGMVDKLDNIDITPKNAEIPYGLLHSGLDFVGEEYG